MKCKMRLLAARGGSEWRERSLVVIFTKQQFSLAAAAAAAAVAAILCEVQLTLISA